MRMLYPLQHDDGAAVCISGFKDTVFETQEKKHEDLKQSLELQVRESPWSGWQGAASPPISIGHHLVSTTRRNQPHLLQSIRLHFEVTVVGDHAALPS